MIWLILWLLLAGPLWALIGSSVISRRYHALGLNPRRTRSGGGLTGAAFGPLGIGYLYRNTPDLRGKWALAGPSMIVVLELWLIFRAVFPQNICNTNPAYVADQLANGLATGLLFSAMAVGLTLIYSVLGIISFAHGQFFMLGGVVGFFLGTEVWELNAIAAIPVAGLVALVVGMIFERLMLSPMHRGSIERAGEYAILVTFGFGLFLQFALVGFLGNPTGVRAPRYTDRPLFGIDTGAFDLGPFRVRTDVVIAGLIGVVLILALAWFLQRTWTGKSFRAVSQQKDAASVVGINSGRTFNLAFGAGTMLAAMAGAALVPTLNFAIPQIAGQAAIRAYIIIVLGGLGSVIGAGIGGVIVGVSESIGAGCFPDPSRASSYQLAFPLIFFALVLLVRPQGLFGRAE
ncbi:MAG: branched-chain amino acid ABC transporter permease [Acidimicrobiia bacterium]